MKTKDQYTEDDDRALRDLANAMDNLRKGVGGAAGTGAEKKYQDAYLKCVRLELKPKMKRKI